MAPRYVTTFMSPANATAPQWGRDHVEKTFPPRSAYEDHMVAFNASNHESGLYGPVSVR